MAEGLSAAEVGNEISEHRVYHEHVAHERATHDEDLLLSMVQLLGLPGPPA